MLRNDLAANEGPSGEWQPELAGCDALVIAHAQIGGIVPEEFVRNNIHATERLLEAALRHKVPYIVSISSSVVNSLAVDSYTETKKAQEALVAASGINKLFCWLHTHVWLVRPKTHRLARSLYAEVPIFPVPGSGKILRQPLFAGDFCDIIVSACETERTGAYNITGRECIDYIDLIRAVKKATDAKAHIQTIPYGLFCCF